MTNENSTIYFAQTENTLHIDSKKEDTLRIIDINGTTIDVIKITDNRSTVNLSDLPRGIYIAIFDKLTLKIIK